MKRGRPTDFSKDFIQKVDEYLSVCQDEDKQVVKQSGENYETYENKLKVKLPTVEGFAIFIGVSKRVLYNWEKEHEDFMHALDKIRTEQQERLMNEGLAGNYNSTIAKLILSSNHGMRERTDTDVTTNGGSITKQQFSDNEKSKLLGLLDDN